MDNLYPWKKYVHTERGNIWAYQLRGATYNVAIGDKWDFDAITGVSCLNYTGSINSKIRDGLQIKECFVGVEIKNNSNIDYIVHKYICRNRFDSNESVASVANNSMAYQNITNQGDVGMCSPATFANTTGNWPPNLTLYDLAEVTAHYKFKKTRFILKAGKVLKFFLHPDRTENRIFNTAVLYGNDRVYKAGKTVTCFMTFQGCMGHENDLVIPGNGITVRSEVEGLDIEQTFHYCARMVKEPVDIGNLTRYYNPTVADLTATNITVPNGAYNTNARNYP